MKSRHSEQYYRDNWDRYIKKVPGPHYINLEEELEHNMLIFAELPKEACDMLRKIEAKKISEKAENLVRSEMATIKAIEAGEASLGYTTKGQEIQAMNEFIRRFEFNCLQLADFNKKELQ